MQIYLKNYTDLQSDYFIINNYAFTKAKYNGH